MPVWTPHRLRHSAGTIVRKRYGLDAAQIVLGHRHAKTAEIYAEISTAKAVETPIGNLPANVSLDLTGLDDVSPEDLAELLRVDAEGWLSELPKIREYYEQFGSHLPKQLLAELDALKERLEAAG